MTAYQRQQDVVDFQTGLSTIGQHARQLCYRRVILFLDELILWLATHLANVEFVTTEASKLAALVEASKVDRPVSTAMEPRRSEHGVRSAWTSTDLRKVLVANGS